MDEPRRSSRRVSARLAAQEENSITTEPPTVATQSKSVNGKNSKGAGKTATETSTKGKRARAFDEDDDGFTFSRTKAKKAKTAQLRNSNHEIPPPETNEPATEEAPVAAKTSRKSTHAEQSTSSQGGRRKSQKARKTSPEVDTDATASLDVPRKRPRAADSKESVPRTPAANNVPSAKGQADEQGTLVTKILLPFADTPIIRRNQEMRKTSGGSRRSSLGLRGRRASSLIGSGKSHALPHEEVQPEDYYKYIESSLMEPRRMRQALTWCGSRSLLSKTPVSTSESSIHLAAREIQQQLLKELSTRADLSDWFSRDEVAAKKPIKPKANPKNIQSAAKIKEVEELLQKKRAERAELESLLKESSNTIENESSSQYEHVSVPDATSQKALSERSKEHLASLAKYISGPSSSTTNPYSDSKVRDRLAAATTDLQFKIDVLAEQVHSLTQYRQLGEVLGQELQKSASELLDQRDESLKEEESKDVGIKDVLRTISRVAN